MGTRDVVVVVQKDDHSLGYFDFATGEELRRVPLPNYPHEFAISSDGRFAYSCHFGLKLAEDEGPGGDEVSVVDLAAAKWVRSISCRGWRRPHGIAFDANGRLYVLSEGSSRLLVIPDPATGNIARALPTHGSGSHIVAVTRDGAVAFCSNMFSGSVSVLSPQEEDAPVRVLSAGERPEGSAFDATEQRLLVLQPRVRRHRRHRRDTPGDQRADTNSTGSGTDRPANRCGVRRGLLSRSIHDRRRCRPRRSRTACCVTRPAGLGRIRSVQRICAGGARAERPVRCGPRCWPDRAHDRHARRSRSDGRAAIAALMDPIDRAAVDAWKFGPAHPFLSCQPSSTVRPDSDDSRTASSTS